MFVVPEGYIFGMECGSIYVVQNLNTYNNKKIKTQNSKFSYKYKRYGKQFTRNKQQQIILYSNLNMLAAKMRRLTKFQSSKGSWKHRDQLSPIQYLGHSVVHHTVPVQQVLSYISGTVTSDSLEFAREIKSELQNPYEYTDDQFQDLVDFKINELDD